MNYKISIVMPVYNREDLLANAIKSIISQTYNNWELILIDDCSTDSSFKIAKDFSEKDKRIKVYKLNQNSGVAVARHEGNLKATGSIIVVADSDDESYPNRLELVNDYFTNNPDTDIYYANVDLFYPDKKIIRKRFFQPYNKDLLHNINYIPNPSSAYKKQVYMSVSGYDRNFRASEDYDLWLQFSDKNFKFGYENISVVKMTMHAGSIRIDKNTEMKKLIRETWHKHGITKSNIETVKKLANKETSDFFTSPEKIDRWFS